MSWERCIIFHVKGQHQRLMDKLVIYGNKPLNGTVDISGAKNAVLPMMTAALLTEGVTTIHKVPDLRDTRTMIRLLEMIGAGVEYADGTLKIDGSSVNKFEAPYELVKTMRASFYVMGPLLGRFGEVKVSLPGGCAWGPRPVDFHLMGMEKLGADVTLEQGYILAKGSKLNGANICFDFPSVGATGNVVMAAVLAKGQTTIYNAACEPYLQQLCKMLNRMGAKISGIGSNMLIIDGVERLGGTEHKMLPDMIEIGSWIGLAAMTKSELTIKDVSWDDLGQIPSVFRKLGITVEQQGDDIHIPAHTDGYQIQNYIDGSILTIADAPWPGFTPDLLSIVLVIATQARGEVLIHQKMFESRLFFVDKLIDMGAKIILCDPHRATVIGHDFKSQLKATTMTSPDIRAGISLLIAALSAKGTSIIHNIEQIDRGYEDIDDRLRAIGAKIERVPGN